MITLFMLLALFLESISIGEESFEQIIFKLSIEELSFIKTIIIR